MSKLPTTCDAERLRQLLADQLPEKLAEETAEHVAACSRCRRALELLAGEPSWWSEVATCLGANLRKEGASSCAPRAATGECHTADEFLDADFAVEFLAPCDRPEALGRLGEFEILEVLGRGGMGVVLKGYQRDLGRYVAIKLMAPQLAASGSARKRFAREARAAAAIVHPHVMAIHSVTAAGRLPYLVMPYVPCESLQQRLDRNGPLELGEILRIGVQTAAGLAAAHAQGLVHRDVKPANILLEKSVDRVMLTDFGLARAADDASLTRTGVIAGTPQFMSPEQARGDAVDHRTDLFSLGSVLYVMCTGRPPFRAETSYGVLRRITDTEPRPVREINPEIPEWLTEIVGRLHAKKPAERFSTAEEVSQLLEQCLAHVQQPTVSPLPEFLRESPATIFKTDTQQVRSSTDARGIIAAAVAAISLIAGWQGWLMLQHGPTNRANPSQPTFANASKLNATIVNPRSYDDPPATAWGDGSAQQIHELSADANELEQRASKLWDARLTNTLQECSP
jgi:serine/threonine-protein kinase